MTDIMRKWVWHGRSGLLREIPGTYKKASGNNHMDDFTHNKAIQKIRESYRVSREEKEELNRLKR